MAVFRPIDKILKGIFLTVFVLCGILFIAFTVRWMLRPGQESQMNYGNSLLYFRARSFADGGSSVRAGCHVLLSSFIVGYAVLMIMLNASVRDFTPESKAGQFQGIRMIFYVLLPMVIGPAIGSYASMKSAEVYTDEYNVIQHVPTSKMFLYAAIVAAFVFLPLAFLIKKGFIPAESKESAPAAEENQ